MEGQGPEKKIIQLDREKQRRVGGGERDRVEKWGRGTETDREMKMFCGSYYLSSNLAQLDEELDAMKKKLTDK